MVLTPGVLAAGLAATLLMTLPVSPTKLTRHEAKVRTFATLLRVTESVPDAADATHANITVGGCKRITAGAWICKGSLYPVTFSGIDGSTCSYVVTVTASRTRLKDNGC